MIDWNVPVTIARVGNTVVNVKLPKLSGMIKSLPLILIAATLVGCYVPNDRLWNLRVREKVTVGIPLDRALAQLHEMKITCESTMPSASGTLGCPTRNQKSPLLPFTGPTPQRYSTTFGVRCHISPRVRSRPMRSTRCRDTSWQKAIS